MPFHGGERVPIKDPANGKTYTIDWRSALHHVLTMEYCFDVTHVGIAGIRQWASQSTIDPAQFTYLTNNADMFNNQRATNQVCDLMPLPVWR